MPEVSNGDLMMVLLEIKDDMGSLKAKAEGHTAWMTKHVEDDKVLAGKIADIQLIQAKQRGFLTAIGVIGSILGSVGGWLFERFGLGHH